MDEMEYSVEKRREFAETGTSEDVEGAQGAAGAGGDTAGYAEDTGLAGEAGGRVGEMSAAGRGVGEEGADSAGLDADGTAGRRQTREENARFADMRRKQEIERLRGELREREQTIERMQDLMMAGGDGMSPEAAFAAMQVVEQQEQMRQARERYRSDAIEYRKMKDLEKIRAVYPDVGSLDDIGDDFYLQRIVCNHWGEEFDPVMAYEVCMKKKERLDGRKPPSTGSMRSAGGRQRTKDYYSSQDVDRLGAKELDDPRVLGRVMRSMTKWNKR